MPADSMALDVLQSVHSGLPGARGRASSGRRIPLSVCSPIKPSFCCPVFLRSHVAVGDEITFPVPEREMRLAQKS